MWSKRFCPLAVASIAELTRGIVRIVRHTHRHPANRALHFAAILPYAAGITTLLAGAHDGDLQQLLAGASLWSAAIAMMLTGHAIEGNLKSITPVLVARLLVRAVHGKGNPGRKRVQLIRG